MVETIKKSNKKETVLKRERVLTFFCYGQLEMRGKNEVIRNLYQN